MKKAENRLPTVHRLLPTLFRPLTTIQQAAMILINQQARRRVAWRENSA